MRRVIEALELRAVQSAKSELDSMVEDTKNSLQLYIEDISNISELNHAYRILEKIVGVLQLMQMHGAVMLTRELNEVIKSLVEGNAQRVDEAQEVVSRGILRLAEYIDHVQAGRKDIPIVLLPLMNDLRASRDAPLLSENVLFFPNIDQAPLPHSTQETISDMDAWLRLVRSKFQKALLQCMQGNNVPDASAQICKLFIHLHKVSSDEATQRFWWVASAVAQAVAINGLEFGASMASLFSALDRQIKQLIQTGETEFAGRVPESLLKNMLYYVAIADERGRIVSQVKEAFALNEHIPPEYKIKEICNQISSPNNEVLLAVSKAMLEDLAILKDYVELYVHSHYEKKEYVDKLYVTLQKVADTLAMVGIDDYRDKVIQELDEVDQIKTGKAGDVELSLLSVSEMILEVETCINNFISYRNSQSHKADNQLAKINNQNVSEGSIDSEFQLAFQRMLSELILLIERLKDAVVECNKDTSQLAEKKEEITDASDRLVRVIRVMQLDELIPLVEGIYQYTTSKEFDMHMKTHSMQLDQFADCIISLQCYLEQIEANMPLAEQILQYCSDSLFSIAGASRQEKPDFSKDLLQQVQETEQAGTDEVDSSAEDVSLTYDLAKQKVAEVDDDDAELFVTVNNDVESLYEAESSEDSLNLPDLNELQSEKVTNYDDQDDDLTSIEINEFIDDDEAQTLHSLILSSEPSLSEELADEGVSEDENPAGNYAIIKSGVDQEILKIFCDEAQIVLEQLHAALEKDAVEADHWLTLNDMRRAYHTLKGSGRLAGAERLGEFAWTMESLLNRVIHRQPEISTAFMEFMAEAVDCCAQLIEQVTSNADSEDQSGGLIIRAKKMLESGDYNPGIAQKISSDVPSDPVLSAIFAQEATQHLKVLRLALDDEAVDHHLKVDEELLRALHTLRGSSRTAGAKSIADTCTLLEDIVKSKSEKDCELSDKDIELLSRAVEFIYQCLERFENERAYCEVDSELIERLEALKEKIKWKSASHDPSLVTNSVHESQRHEMDADNDVQQPNGDSGQNDQDDVFAPAVNENEVSEEPVSVPEVDHDPLPVSAGKEYLVDLPLDRDKDLCEIFFEEAEDILASCQGHLQTWRDKGDSHEPVSELRRRLHTLKGSSRMADYNSIGKLSHVTESLVIAIADHKITADEATFELLQSVLDQFHVMLDAARSGSDVRVEVGFIDKIVNAARGALEEEPAKETFEKNNEDVVAIPEVSNDVIDSRPVSKTDDAPVVFETPAQQSSDMRIEDAPDSSLVFKPAPPLNAGSDASKPVKKSSLSEIVRVNGDSLDEFVNDAGEVSILHSRLEQLMGVYTFNLTELDQTVLRLRDQLRKLEMETEKQVLFKHAQETERDSSFDPLEMDRYSEMQQLSRALAESVEDLYNIKEMLADSVRGSEELLIQQEKVTSNLQHGLLRTRMVQFRDLEARLHRIVRQTSVELGKQVLLEIDGGTSELDRSILDKIVAPLEHLLRNSISHGIEDKETRIKLGKAQSGLIRIHVRREGPDIVIKLSDDGAGIDPAAVLKKAVANGLIDSSEQLTDEEACYLILKPGLSTANTVSQISGRGVGMDVVDKEIRQLGGTLKIASTLGQGVQFTIKLPFTLAVTQALLVQCCDEVYALTLSGIEGVIRLSGDELTALYESKQPVYQYADREYPFYHLGSLLGAGAPSIEDLSTMYPVILLGSNDRRLALHVEASLGNKEIVIKSLSSPLIKAKGISGATILADGSVALIIDVPWVMRRALSEQIFDRDIQLPSVASRSVQPPLVMVIDDSITIRKVTTKFLEKNKFSVETAKDGIDALQKLQKITPDIILLDIEMPRMDGYELASHIRNDDRLKAIPIIMITSRSGDKHRQKAMEVGVQKYLGKPYNEIQLLEHIREFSHGRAR